MNIKEAILAEHSKENTIRIALWIGGNKERQQQLIDLFLHDEYRVVQRAAWIISYVAQAHPQMMETYLPQLVHRMDDKNIPVAVKRNVVRILQFLPIPVALHETVMNHCFGFVADEKETVAVRAFSMTVLARIVPQYPELKNELQLILEDALQHQEVTAGFISRAKKIIKLLS